MGFLRSFIDRELNLKSLNNRNFQYSSKYGYIIECTYHGHGLVEFSHMGWGVTQYIKQYIGPWTYNLSWIFVKLILVQGV